MLPQPFAERLAGARRVLLAGCGGGYDVFGAIPLLVELRAQGCDVFLANHSFCSLPALPGATVDPTLPNLYAVTGASARLDAYCPEAWLARWCREYLGPAPAGAQAGDEWIIWSFTKTGAQPLHAAYERLVATLDLDAVVLIDGGIDVILRGDESSLGTPAEDLVSLAAVAHLDVPTRLIACLGFGGELRDGICHEQVFARIAALTARQGHLGAASVLAGTRAGDAYLDAVSYTFANQLAVRTSHIHTVVSQAIRGEYGARGPHIWISPLLNLYWFFDLPAVADEHLFLNLLWETQEIWEISVRVEGVRKTIDIAPRSRIPL